MTLKKKTKASLISESIIGIDDPLINPSYDCLDRNNFAKRIFTLIDTTPLDTHLRIGILGDWGSGKTTVMNFIRYYCYEKGHPVAVFHPWQFHSKEDAWKGFVASLDKGLALWGNLPIGNFKRKKIIKDISGKARQLAEIANTTIGKAIGELILSPLENLLNETKANVTKDLKSLLKDKRLYVFIDDLDRAEPEIVYDMLMLLNEIFDIKQCVYIIGLDIKTVSQVLRNKLGYINPKDFIDKIINWPFELPVPSSFDWEALLEKELNNVTQDVVKDAVISILDILPRNPRRFKHYLRYLNSLHKGFLSRFGKDELDWKMLYIAQLLRMEFPEVFRSFMQEDEIVKDIANGRLWDKERDLAQSEFGSNKKSDVPEWKKKIEQKINKYKDIDKERFLCIYESLRNCGGFTSSERVRNHLLVIEVPELMTWSEYGKFKGRLVVLDDISVTSELRKFISVNRKSKDIERIREFMKMLLRDREQIWDNLIGLHSQKEMKIQIERVTQIMRICNLLTDIEEIFSGINPLFDKTTFEEWFDFLSKWAHFKEHKNLAYKHIRKTEKDLLLKMISKNLNHASDMSEWLRLKFRNLGPVRNTEDIADVKKKIDKILEKRLTEDLLARFEEIDGIKEFWPRDSYVIEKKILFMDGSSFHNKETYIKLNIIAAKAKNNIEIQKNFVEVIRLLFYYATEHSGWMSPEEVRPILMKREFFSIIWDAAVCCPLNRRLVGSLEEYLKALNSIVKDEEYFKRPKWWLALIADKADK